MWRESLLRPRQIRNYFYKKHNTEVSLSVQNHQGHVTLQRPEPASTSLPQSQGRSGRTWVVLIWEHELNPRLGDSIVLQWQRKIIENFKSQRAASLNLLSAIHKKACRYQQKVTVSALNKIQRAWEDLEEKLTILLCVIYNVDETNLTSKRLSTTTYKGDNP